MPRAKALSNKAENVIIVSTIPGPKEPHYDHLNPYLDNLVPMVNDLLLLWEGVKFSTPHSMVSCKLVKAPLCCVSFDSPATRKIFCYGYQATYGCSKCLKHFPSSYGVPPHYSGFDRSL